MNQVPMPGTHHPDFATDQADAIREFIDDHENRYSPYIQYIVPTEDILWNHFDIDVWAVQQIGQLNVRRCGNTWYTLSGQRVSQTWWVAVNEDHWVASRKVLTELGGQW